LGVEVNFIPALSEMPIATNLFQSGFGPFWLAYGLGVDSTYEWIAMTLSVLLIALIITVPLIKRRFPNNVQFTIVLIAALPVLSTQFSWLGMYDPFIFLGLIIWGLTNRPLFWFIGGFIAASANPEQVTVAALLTLLASFAFKSKGMRSRSLVLLGTALVCILLSQLWFMLSGSGSGRSGELAELLEPSLYSFSMYWPLYIWGIFGALWLIVLLVITSLPSKVSVLFAFVLLLGIPLISASLTLDGYRVLALVALPITLLIVGYFIDSQSQTKNKSLAPILAVSILALLIFAPPAELSWPAVGPLIYDYVAQYL
jgi:hypothetical protein